MTGRCLRYFTASLSPNAGLFTLPEGIYKAYGSKDYIFRLRIYVCMYCVCAYVGTSVCNVMCLCMHVIYVCVCLYLCRYRHLALRNFFRNEGLTTFIITSEWLQLPFHMTIPVTLETTGSSALLSSPLYSLISDKTTVSYEPRLLSESA
jgi:hypothetical protein